MFVTHDSFRRRLVAVAMLTASAGLLGILSACTSNSAPLDDPTTRALNDPMNYPGNANDDSKYNVSGGGLNNFDSKAFKRDMDGILNP
jgi:hypothetical protein